MRTVDFSRSFLTFRLDVREQTPVTVSHKPPTPVNNVRIQLECVCDIEDRGTGRTRRYVLGASCKTERVGVPQDIWTEPNADFRPAVSDEEFLLLKSWQKNDMGVMLYPPSRGVQPERQVGLCREAWTSFGIHVRETAARALDCVDEIVASTFAHRPMVARLEYEEGGFHVRIDHPVKTINVSEVDGIFQTDTGPILLPDFSRASEAEPFIDVFDLAYAAFNASDWAECIVRVPTPVAEGVSVNHYARSRRIDNMRNQLFEITGKE